jgi:hypothetical protein
MPSATLAAAIGESIDLEGGFPAEQSAAPVRCPAILGQSSAFRAENDQMAREIRGSATDEGAFTESRLGSAAESLVLDLLTYQYVN